MTGDLKWLQLLFTVWCRIILSLFLYFSIDIFMVSKLINVLYCESYFRYNLEYFCVSCKYICMEILSTLYSKLNNKTSDAYTENNLLTTVVQQSTLLSSLQ